MEEGRWTLDELAERVDAALAVDYHGQSSGRVRDVPDRRAIRWYTTIGLVARPGAHRGRVALYGPRHLLQLVAIKRLQARGLPLVAIQQELAGATDSQLARVARLPGTASTPPVAANAGPPAGKVPAGAPAASATAAPRPAPGPARRAAFWREPPAAAPTADATSLRGVRLGDGATLLLEPGRELDAADLQAVTEAAQPLLAVLRDRRLGGLPVGDGEPRREHP